MLGERNSVFKSIFLNPRIFIGFVLTLFTLNYEKDDPFGIFFNIDTYRNLAIGSAIFVGLFDRQYTAGMNKLDWNQTLGNVLEAMLVIGLSWFFSLSLIVGYQHGGQNYSRLLRERYQKQGFGTESSAQLSDEARKALENMELKSGQKYTVTPNEDGSITVEVK